MQDCSTYTLSFDTTVFIIESMRRRVAVEAMLENRGENAYSTVLNISQSTNLQFASLIQKVRPGRPTQPARGEGQKLERRGPDRETGCLHIRSTWEPKNTCVQTSPGGSNAPV